MLKTSVLNICAASNKQEFERVYERFLTDQTTNQSMLFEVFTNSADESEALEKIMNINENVKGRAKQLAKQVLGENTSKLLKKILK